MKIKDDNIIEEKQDSSTITNEKCQKLTLNKTDS